MNDVDRGFVLYYREALRLLRNDAAHGRVYAMDMEIEVDDAGGAAAALREAGEDVSTLKFIVAKDGRVSMVVSDPDRTMPANLSRVIGSEPCPTPLDVAVTRAVKGVQIAGMFVPPRIEQEEIGDLLEVVHQYRREGRPAWQIYVRAITGVFFVLWHSFSEKIATLKKIGG